MSLTFAWSFLNAPLIGAFLGCVIGLAPPLHKAFFNEPDQGGIFKAWLTASVKNAGDLFATLQVSLFPNQITVFRINNRKYAKLGTREPAGSYIPMSWEAGSAARDLPLDHW